MLKQFIVLGIIGACYSESILIDPRVIGGSPAEIENFPYAVSIQVQGSKTRLHISTGTILNNRWILTTASRLKYFPILAAKVHTGSTNINAADGVDYGVEEQIQHPSYDPNKFEFEMTLLKVDQDIVFNEKTASIGLYSEDSVDANLAGSLLGWGDTYINNLKTSRLYSIVLQTVGTVDGMNLYISVIGDDICYTDVGGPFVVNGLVLGISTVNRLGCGSIGQHVTRFDVTTLEWINSNILLKPKM